MSRKTDRELTRRKPELEPMVNMAKGDRAAADAVDDAKAEEGIERMTGKMMIDTLVLDKTIWIETPNWVYVGIVDEIGRDYFLLRRCARMISDGRHHTMMQTGRAERMELEPSGGPSRLMCFPIDWLGPHCEWPFPIPDEAI